MGKDRSSKEVYTRMASEAKKTGSATSAGEQRHKEGKGLHELVDPKGYGVIRRSLTWLEPDPKGGFFLLRGVAMLEETRLDTTGSMGNNVEIAMRVLPQTYELLVVGPGAVLGRYDVQMITSIFGDVVDDYVLCRSQAEMDKAIAEQMTLMVPEGKGGDADEDPQYGLFGAAYLTKCSISDYGLKSYDFTVTDARGRNHLSAATLKRVFGDSVFEKVAENGHQINANNLPTTKEVVQDLLKISHAFLLQVGDDHSVGSFWQNIFGRERVVVIPRAELLPEVKAAIIGLTEGNLSLQNLGEFLKKEANLSQSDAENIRRAVAGIPIGAQALLPGFDKIPLAGAKFANKGDIWPSEIKAEESTGSEKDKPAGEKMWL